MQNHKVLAAVCLLMMLTALLATRSIARWEFPQPTPVDLNQFPVRIGTWTAGEDRPMTDEVRKVLQTAKSLDKTWTQDKTGSVVQLLLLTGKDTGDFHNPAVCLPAQGWTPRLQRTFSLNGQNIHETIAEQGDQTIKVWYWWYSNDPYKKIRLPGIPFARDLYKLRLKAAGDNASTSLFVRVIATGSADRNGIVGRFVGDIWPHVEALASTGGSRFSPSRLKQQRGAD